MELPFGERTLFLDGLVIQTILETLDDVKALASAAAVSKAFRIAAHDVASDSLLLMLKVRAELRPTSHYCDRSLDLSFSVCAIRAQHQRCYPCISTCDDL